MLMFLILLNEYPACDGRNMFKQFYLTDYLSSNDKKNVEIKN